MSSDELRHILRDMGVEIPFVSVVEPLDADALLLKVRRWASRVPPAPEARGPQRLAPGNGDRGRAKARRPPCDI
jgi:hypothetical protein